MVFAEGLDHPECVIYHPEGTLWAGGEAGQIYRISDNGKVVEEVANTQGFVLGIALSPDCSWLLICDLANKCLWRMEMDSYKLTKFADGVLGHLFNIPNYACFDKKGNIYVSESGGFRRKEGKILKFDKEGNGEVWSAGPFNFANGIALDASEEYLYVVCSFMPGVERIAIKKNGTAGHRQMFVTLPETVPDGLAFDTKGNLYVSCYSPNKIYRVLPDSTISVLVEDWEAHTLSNPTNMAFGGADFDQLFTSNLGRWHISKIDMGVKGLKLVCHHG